MHSSLRTVRCAIYTRKSTDEGLDQAFNSLDAQREACEAYIASQRHERWTALADRYDDGGYSGGTLQRPALGRLLADVAAKRVDVIVLYKIDRLTRALSDFARIVEVLDKAGASFVSVTQSFNTTTSMGRLTLNVLLSFAQFERENGAERVRDKIAASKKKGMWMGGVCPLGYEVRDRKLVVSEPEAGRVRDIFELYLELGSVITLELELQRRGIYSKCRVRPSGAATGGGRLTRGALYVMLTNRTYIGEVTHRGQSYLGQHDGIVARECFDAAQELLASNRVRRRHGENANYPSLLAGIVYDSSGRRLKPSHSCKGPVRYRYYQSSHTRPGAAVSAPMRLPAGQLESLVLSRLSALLRNRHGIVEALGPAALDAVALEASLFEAKRLADTLASEDPVVVRRVILRIVSRIEVAADEVAIVVSLVSLLPKADKDSPEVPTALLRVPAKLARRAKEVRLVVGVDGDGRPEPDPGLVKLVVKAHEARQALFAGGGKSLAEVATEQGYALDYFTVLVKLGFLAPELTTRILDGRQPKLLTRQHLARIRALPMQWDQQRCLLLG